MRHFLFAPLRAKQQLPTFAPFSLRAFACQATTTYFCALSSSPLCVPINNYLLLRPFLFAPLRANQQLPTFAPFPLRAFAYQPTTTYFCAFFSSRLCVPTNNYLLLRLFLFAPLRAKQQLPTFAPFSLRAFACQATATYFCAFSSSCISVPTNSHLLLRLLLFAPLRANQQPPTFAPSSLRTFECQPTATNFCAFFSSRLCVPTNNYLLLHLFLFAPLRANQQLNTLRHFLFAPLRAKQQLPTFAPFSLRAFACQPTTTYFCAFFSSRL
ncbi:MAG: hypothetical protein IPK62_06945 [Bacteroidetes bacterium]|nr:hypothetical protein [Bacteroidota bacterium]